MTKKANNSPVGPARNPSSAWCRIVEMGGLEPKGRDSDFVDLVKARLNPEAADIEAALTGCIDNETLLRAVFDVVAPFSAMSRDIVDFMRRAGARRGKETIQIAIEHSVLGLEEFEEFIAALHQAPGVIQILDASIGDAFDLMNVARRTAGGAALAEDVAEWLEAFQLGEFHELPASVSPGNVPAELSDLARISATALEALRSVATRREAIDGFLGDFAHRIGKGTVSDPRAISAVEHDLMGSLISALGHAVQQTDHVGVVSAIAPIIVRIPRRLVSTTGDVAALEKVLSLPAWKKRFELYAVWIATRISVAVEPERVAIHADESDALPFNFRATHLMTIQSAEGPKYLWAERKTDCVNPIGKNRTGRVQPDYGLWSGAEGADSCNLIVEVKHYKTPVLNTFGAALVDYATAHPDAQTILVNYGRESGVVDHERWSHQSVFDRCHEIGDLQPYNRLSCERFARLVRDAVGPAPHPDLVLLDVSGSMREFDGQLRVKDVVQSWLRQSEQAHINRVIAAEDGIKHWDLSRLEAVDMLNGPIPGGGGDPLSITRDLLQSMKRIWVVTDSSGVNAFRSAKFQHFAHLRHMTGVDLVEIGVG